MRIVEGNFHARADPMFNDTDERNELSLQCRPGNWIVQIDCDELPLPPPPAPAEAFREFLLNAADPDALVLARWYTVYKRIGDTALIIDPASEGTPVATRRRGAYTHARYTRQRQMKSALNLLHFSWGRSEAEVEQKLANWSHAQQFNAQAFLERWRALTLDNYGDYRDFHPIAPATWRGLRAVELPGHA